MMDEPDSTLANEKLAWPIALLVRMRAFEAPSATAITVCSGMVKFLVPWAPGWIR